MAIYAELFDGTRLEFPDGTDPAVIQATAKKVTQSLPPPQPEKPEDVGFLRGAGAAIKRGVESFEDVTGGLGLAATALTGTEGETTQKMQEIKRQQAKPQETPGLTAADIERLYKEKGLGAAAGQVPSYVTQQILQSAPQMAVPIAAGSAAAALSGPFAPVVGPAVGIGAYGVQQFGNFLTRQAVEKKDAKELEIGKAAMTAAGTAPLGYFADRFTVGLSTIGKKAGPEIVKELTARQLAGQVGKRVAVGAAEGVIAEAPTEVLEQAAERYQAGLSLTGDDAMNEYKEAFFGASAAGGGMGAASRGIQGYKEAKAGAVPQPAPTIPPEVTPTQAAPVSPTTPAAPVPEAGGQDIQSMIDELRGVTPAAPVEAPPVQPTAQVPSPEVNQNIAKLEEEYKSINPKYENATPEEFAQLNARQKQIKSEIAKLRESLPPTEVQYLSPKELKKDWMHGTTEEAAKKITESGRFEPAKGKKQYSYSQLGAESTYLAPKGSWWLDKEKAAKGAAKEYPTAIQTELSPKAKIAKIDTVYELDALSNQMGFADTQDFLKSLMTEDYGTATQDNYRQTMEKFKELGIDGIYFGKDFAKDESGMDYPAPDQLAVFNQSVIKPVSKKPAEVAAPKTLAPEIQTELKDLYKERDKLKSTGDNLIPWLKKYGVKPEAKADMGIEKGDRRLPVGIFKKAGYGLDELARAAVNDGIITEADLATQPDEVEAFRNLIYDAVQGNISKTPFNLENMAKLEAVQQRIEQLESPEYSLTAETSAESEARLREEEAARKAKEDAEIEAEMAAKAEQSRAEIARRSAQQAQNFALGQTPEESLTGQQRLDDDIPFFSMERPNERPYTRQVANAERVLNEKIDELRRVNTSRAAIKNRFETERIKPTDQMFATQLRKKAKILEDEIDNLKWETRNNSAEKFLARAGRALADKEIDKDVYNVINDIYQKEPNLLEGLKLRVIQGTPPSDIQSFQAAGEFVGRIVKLYKDTSGVEDPSVVRHELTHSLEQVMSRDAKKKLVQEWRNALDKAQAKEKTKEGKDFFKALLGHLENPTKDSFTQVSQMMPTDKKDYYYQFMSPSEYWAVNAEKLLKARLGGAWEKFKNFVNRLYQSLKNLFGFDNTSLIHKTFEQVIKGKREGIGMLTDLQRGVTPKYSMEKAPDYEGEARNYKGKPVKATWDLPEDTTTRVLAPFDQTIQGLIYKFQDKQIDTKDAQKAIEKAAGKIADEQDVYEQEQLYHGRTATGIREFLLDELMPAIKDLQKLKLTPEDIKQYLHNRHAEERNNKMNEVNKLDPVTGEERETPWELQDRASGISTKDAREYLAKLDPQKKAALEKVADRFDKMVKDTQKILIDSGAESKDTVEAWNNTYEHYVPLFRIEDDFNKVSGGMGATGASKGFGTRGGFSKRAMGSEKEVQDILGNLIAQRERALIRAEKIKVGKALYGLALLNPNPDLWLPVNPDAIKSKDALMKELEGLGFDDAESIANNLMQEPKTRYISKEKKLVTDPVTGLPMMTTQEAVKLKIDNLKRFGDNVFPIRIDGKDRYIFFNKNNPRAVRMVHSLLNLDVDNLGFVTSNIAKLTRWFASVNTQYNPIFGAVNLIRDVGGANFNLTSTAIAGEQAKVTKGVIPAMRGILNVLRDERKGKTDTKGKWAQAFQEFRKEGGQTGYRDSLIRTEEEKQVIERELSKMKAGNAKKAFTAVMGALSDFNDMMENSVRVSAYVAAKDKGLSPQKAAILAKNLTVNFDKKGQLSAAINSYYAFFNASIQGTARLAQTLKGPKGKAIMAGGIALGTMQAILLAAAGYGDDEPPEFVKERNFIIPLPSGKYITIPYPLGLHILPNVGRISTELVLQGGKKAGDKIANLTGAFADAFSPLGSSGLSAQSFAPTVADPFLALEANKDAFGRPIYKKDQATNPTPGYLRSRDSASEISKTIAYYLNLASGGTKYSKGFASPTADQIDYVAGQITGGVGREILKTEQSIKGAITGEEVPAYRIPLAGRFYGETESPAAEAQRFYTNIVKMSEHENEIKGRIKNKEPVGPYLREHPEARLWQTANTVENQINALNKQKKDFIERGLPKDRIKRIENQKTMMMKRFNDQLAKYEE